MKPHVLFLLKKNLIYGSYSSVIAKSGLLNSARITSEQLKKYLNILTDIEVCVDGNEVDKFVDQYKPNVCIIEAFWVTPTKLKELTKLHPKVIFVVLCHSEIAFLAQEGIAVKWILEYDKIDNVFPAFNSKETYEQFIRLSVSCFYLPNIYLDVPKGSAKTQFKNTIDIASFGAIRPFKNQLFQAVAAIIFAEMKNKILHFHINSTRIEQSGESVLKNIKSLFENTKHKLIEHDWSEREIFLSLIKEMDLGLQISLSESFNIVAADFVLQQVPIIVSNTISWMPEISKCDYENIEDALSKMDYAYEHRSNVVNKNTRFLNKYNKRALTAWVDFLGL